MSVDATGRIHGADYSLVDYNRAGVPLIEIVTKPIEVEPRLAPRVAKAYVTELRELIVALGVSDAHMHQGSMRVDANVSLKPRGSSRHSARGPRPRTSTPCAAWSEPSATKSSGRQRCSTPAARSSRRRATSTRADGSTTSGRSKEEAEDYRYFPEPDLVPVAPRRKPLKRSEQDASGAAACSVGSGFAKSGGSLSTRCSRWSTPVASRWWRRPSP